MHKVLEHKARAHTNIAVVKYWGKMPPWEEYHVPTKSSLSFTVKDLYTETRVEASPGSGRVLEVVFGGAKLEPGNKQFKRIQKTIDKWGRHVSPLFKKYDYRIETMNNFPTGAGYASSASGMQALARAVLGALSQQHDEAKELLEDKRRLSAVARMGSGSAARSVDGGIVLWHRGWDKSRDFDPVWGSYAERVGDPYKDLRIIYVEVWGEHKKIGSSEGMARSVRTSPFYWYWVEMEEREISEDLALARSLPHTIDAFLERVMMHSNSFHAVARSSYPPIEYLTDTSVRIVDEIHRLNKEAGSVIAGYTFDAGPNPVIFTLSDHVSEVKSRVARVIGREELIRVTEPLQRED